MNLFDFYHLNVKGLDTALPRNNYTVPAAETIRRGILSKSKSSCFNDC